MPLTVTLVEQIINPFVGAFTTAHDAPYKDELLVLIEFVDDTVVAYAYAKNVFL